MILVGDDYQLPGIGEGALPALFSRYGSKITFKGRQALLECADYVFNLKSSKRIQHSEVETKNLMDRLRLGTDIQDRDVDKLMSLRLDRIRDRHGDHYARDIENRAMYLFYRNDKRNRHNIQQLINCSSKTNPVAVIRSRSHGTTRAKGFN